MNRIRTRRGSVTCCPVTCAVAPATRTSWTRCCWRRGGCAGVAHERPRSGRTRRGRRDGEGTPRIEDAALLRGEARFLDDIPVATPLHACFVRSPHAHARIVSIDLSAARAMPGVTAAYAAADLYGELTEWRMPLGFALADLPANTTPFVLAGSEVAFAGEAVTVVLADSRRQAEDAAAVARVEYEALAAVADCRAALEEGSPRVRSELESNLLQRYTLEHGDCEAAFAGAAWVFAERFWTHRGAAHPMEGRGVLAAPDAAGDALTVWSSTQMAHELHYAIALMLGQPRTSCA